jgi:hypothetical protein
MTLVTGVTFFRSTVGGKAVATHWLTVLVQCFDGDNPGCDDQTSFNKWGGGGRNPVMDVSHNVRPVKRGEGRVYWSDVGDKHFAAMGRD